MRTETFMLELPVDLDETDEREGRARGESRRLRREQASRAWPALARQEQRIKDRKEEQKAEIKDMEAAKERIIATARSANEAAETGREPRQVECREELVGVMVFTRRLDTGEDVGAARPATKQELAAADDAKSDKAKQELAAALPDRIRAGIARLCAPKGREEPALVKLLAKEIKEATTEQIKEIVDGEVEAGRLAEDGGKLLWIGKPPVQSSAPTPEQSGMH